MYNKITTGYVVQVFDENDKPVSQEFVAGDEVAYETPMGESVNPPENEKYLSFDMVQPE